MASIEDLNSNVFDEGPLRRLEQLIGSNKLGRLTVARRIMLAVLIGWVPLAILSGVQFGFSSGEAIWSFIYDFGLHARFLVAIPVLILAESECAPLLGKIVDHFDIGGLIRSADKPAYKAAVSSTRRLSGSTAAGLAVALIAYIAVAALYSYVSPERMGLWHRSEPGVTPALSLAGWWHLLVSLPLFLIIIGGWLVRIALWTRFLFLMTRLDLRLIPGHPDRTGGVRFITASLRGFRLFSFGLGAVAAGALAKLLVLQKIEPVEMGNLMIGLLALLVVLLAGPLTLFIGTLRKAKRLGIFEYGDLARSVGRQFEDKWIRGGDAGEAALQVQDFSATTDLYSVAENAFAMSEIPFGIKDLIGPIVVSSMLPFLPLALLAMPIADIFRHLVRLVL